MPFREYQDEYDDGYAAGYAAATRQYERAREQMRRPARRRSPSRAKPKKTIRKKSKWQMYMKQKKNQIKYKSGDKKGRLNLKKMGVAYRKMKK